MSEIRIRASASLRSDGEALCPEVLVLVATAVMVVVVDPVYPRVNCCVRRSSRRSSLSHEARNRAPVMGRWWWRQWRGKLLSVARVVW